MKEYSRKLIVIAKNDAKQRMHEETVKTNLWELKKENKRQTFCAYWSCYRKIKEKEFTKKKNHLINKFEILKNSTGKKRNQKTTSYIKQAVLNLNNTELKEEQNSLLNLGSNFVPATAKNIVCGHYFGYRNISYWFIKQHQRNWCGMSTSKSKSHS